MDRGKRCFSRELDPNRILWLFGDTFIGEVRDGRHIDAVLVNNTIAVQSGKERHRRPSIFSTAEQTRGEPGAFLRPSDTGLPLS